MKNLKDSLSESVLNNIETTLDASNTNTSFKHLIKDFIKSNYSIAKGIKISKTPNANGKYMVDANILQAKKNITKLTNDAFEFNEVNYFSCSSTAITDLNDTPRKVKVLRCSGCNNITSLDGLGEVSELSCSSCKNLKSLEGCPSTVYALNCSSNAFHSLKGCPNKLKWLNISQCTFDGKYDGTPTEIDELVSLYMDTWVDIYQSDELTPTGKFTSQLHKKCKINKMAATAWDNPYMKMQ